MLTAHASVVDQAIREINAIWRQGGLSTVVAIGDYLIRAFFEGDLELAQSRRPTKEKALSELFSRVDELELSLHALRRAVPIALQYRALPRQVADHLSAAHHAELLPVPQLENKISLARIAIDEGLTSKELRREVRRVHKPQAGGRPRGPALLRLTGGLARAARAEELAKLLKPSALKQLDAHTVGVALAQVRAAREVLEKIEDALARR
jgi:hypothetical protein